MRGPNLLSLLPGFLQRFMEATLHAVERKPYKHYNKSPPPLTAEDKARIAAYGKQRADRERAFQQRRRADRRALLQRQSEREMSGFYEGTPSVASAHAAEGSGRKYRRVKKEPDGKRRPGNLVRVW